MANSLFSPPSIFLHQAAPSSSSLLHLSQRHFISHKSALSGETHGNFLLWSSTHNGTRKFSRYHRKSSVRATNVDDDACCPDIDSPLKKCLEIKIKEHLNAECVILKERPGGHYCIDVICSAFEGHSAMSRQRMVYKVIWEELLSDTVHAVDRISTKTLAELEANSQKVIKDLPL